MQNIKNKMTAPKHRTKIRKLDAGVKSPASHDGLCNTQKIVAEKYRAWLVRRGFREEVL